MNASASRLIAAGASLAGMRTPAWTSPQRYLPSLAVVLLLVLVNPLAEARIGDVDPGYGVNGRFVPPPDSSYYCCMVLADGRLVYWTPEGWGRTDIDGRPDVSFGSGGMQSWPQGYGSIATHERTGDGRLLVVLRRHGAAGTEFAVLRLGLDGEVDRDFGTDGLAAVDVPANGTRSVSATLQLDGKLLLLLEGRPPNSWVINSLVLVRLLADGRLDTAFGTGGSVVVPTTLIDLMDGFNGVSALADGSIVVHTYPATYLTESGVPMSGPGPDLSAWSIAQLLHDGDALAWLSTGEGYRLAKVRADGSLDASFGSSGDGTFMAPSGWSPHQYLAGLTVTQDGRFIYLSWGAYPNGSWQVSRLFANGQVDTSFGEQGTVDFRSTSLSGTAYGLADGSTIVTGGASIAHRLLGQSVPSPGVTGAIQDGRLWLESEGAVELRVFRAAGSDGPVRLRYWTPNASELQQQGHQAYATSGEDFDAVDGVLDWSDGDVGDKVIRISLRKDKRSEGIESIHVRFEALSPGTFNAEDWVTVAIQDSPSQQTPPGDPASGGGKSSGGGSFSGSGLLLMLVATVLVRRQRSQRTVNPIRRPSP